MPFCPKCKNEYRQGIKMCSDCKVELIEDLNDGPVLLAKGDEGVIHEILEFCREKGLVTGYVSYDKVIDTYEIYCDKREVENAANYIKAFQGKKQLEYLAEKNDMAVEDITPELARELMEKDIEERKEAQKLARAKGPARISYEDKREKAGEYKSSGYVLTFVGIGGIVVMILMCMGIIPGFESLRTNYMFLGVMGALFVVFIISGVYSFTRIKTIIGQAEADEDISAKANAFMKEKFTKEVLDHVASDNSGNGVEELFFQRAEYMERELKKEFPDMEDALREKLIDERYSEIYESDNH